MSPPEEVGLLPMLNGKKEVLILIFFAAVIVESLPLRANQVMLLPNIYFYSMSRVMEKVLGSLRLAGS